MEHDSKVKTQGGLEVLAAWALAHQDNRGSLLTVHVEDSSCGVHAAHVHGDTHGRFSLLRALAGRMLFAELGMASSRLQLWAAQLGISSATSSEVWDVRDGLECSGVCVSERVLEYMSTSQLCEVLANAQLTMLYDSHGQPSQKPLSS